MNAQHISNYNVVACRVKLKTLAGYNVQITLSETISVSKIHAARFAL